MNYCAPPACVEYTSSTEAGPKYQSRLACVFVCICVSVWGRRRTNSFSIWREQQRLYKCVSFSGSFVGQLPSYACLLSFLHKERGIYGHRSARLPNNYIATQSNAAQVRAGQRKTDHNEAKGLGWEVSWRKTHYATSTVSVDVRNLSEGVPENGPSAWKCVLIWLKAVFPCKNDSSEDRQMARSPSWAFFSLQFLSKSQLHIGQTEPCCLPSAWHLKQQSVYFLPEISPVVETFKHSFSQRYSSFSQRKTANPCNHLGRCKNSFSCLARVIQSLDEAKRLSE